MDFIFSWQEQYLTRSMRFMYIIVIESHCFDERKDVSSQFKPNLNLIKIRQKLVGSCGPPLPTSRGACGPPYHLSKIFKLCQTSFYELKVIVLMKEKLIPVSLKPNLNLIKIRQKLWSPLTNWWGCLWSSLTT